MLAYLHSLSVLPSKSMLKQRESAIKTAFADYESITAAAFYQKVRVANPEADVMICQIPKSGVTLTPKLYSLHACSHIAAMNSSSDHSNHLKTLPFMKS